MQTFEALSLTYRYSTKQHLIVTCVLHWWPRTCTSLLSELTLPANYQKRQASAQQVGFPATLPRLPLNALMEFFVPGNMTLGMEEIFFPH